jgi:acyl-CoA synthetase (AMP-forming)/AMP-acid ligase II
MITTTGMLLGQALEQAARRFAGRPAIAFEGRQTSYADLDREVNRLANGLAALGVGAGDRVAISLANRPEVFTAYFAAQKLGAVAVLLNYNLTAREVAVIGTDCTPSVWFHDQRTGAAVAEAVAGLTGVRARIACGPRALAGSRGYLSLIEGSSRSRPPRPAIDDSAASLIMYTSGTTGRPKGVVLSHAAQWLNTVLMIAELGFLPDDRALQVAPLYHVAAFHVVALPILFIGGCNVVVEKFDPAGIAAQTEDHAVTCILGAPTHFEMWSRDGTVPAAAARARLRHVVITGAPARPDTIDWIVGHLSANLWDVYGQTEACSLISLVPPDQISRMSAVNCIGRPLMGMDVAHIPADGSVAEGLALPEPPERGELIARGPKLMTGYYGAPDKTAKTIEDGWLRTGDLVQMDADGYYYYLGRVDDMIITGGENVYPVEIEEVLLTCPGIADCVVVGLPDDKWGQVITAFVVAEPGGFEQAEAEALTRARLASHKRPRRWEVIERIPRSPSGKVLVRELVARTAG